MVKYGVGIAKDKGSPSRDRKSVVLFGDLEENVMLKGGPESAGHAFEDCILFIPVIKGTGR